MFSLEKIEGFRSLLDLIKESNKSEGSNTSEDLSNALHNLKLVLKRWKTNSGIYTLLKYDKEGMTCDMLPTIGLLRSVVLDEECNIVSFAPPKSLLVSTEIKEQINKGEWRFEEYVEGTMINLFYNKKLSEWELSTKSTVGANVSFFMNTSVDTKIVVQQNETFRRMFLDTCAGINFNYEILPKEYIYSFVLQHPKNRIVVPIHEPAIYIVAVYKVNQEKLEIEDVSFGEDVFDWNSVFVRKQEIYEMVGGLEGMKEKYASMNTEYYVMGLICRNPVTGERVKFRNPNYEMVKNLRGNQPKLQYQYLNLRKDGKVSDYLKYYPENKKEFRVFRDNIHDFTYQLHDNYIQCYMKKTKPLIEYPGQFRTHMFNLHQIYLNELRERGGVVNFNEVMKYINTLHPSKLMFALNFNNRKQKVDEERAEHKEVPCCDKTECESKSECNSEEKCCK